MAPPVRRCNFGMPLLTPEQNVSAERRMKRHHHRVLLGHLHGVDRAFAVLRAYSCLDQSDIIELGIVTFEGCEGFRNGLYHDAMPSEIADERVKWVVCHTVVCSDPDEIRPLCSEH